MTLPPAKNGNSGTPGRLGRRPAVTDLRAAAAASPPHHGQKSQKSVFLPSPLKAVLHSKTASNAISVTKIPFSSTRRLSTCNVQNNPNTPLSVRKHLKIPATPTSNTTSQKENTPAVNSPLHMRTIANRRATQKRSSKSSIKLKELQLLPKGDQVAQEITKIPKSASPVLTPKATNGRTKLRPKSTILKVEKEIASLHRSPSKRESRIKQTTSGLNIHTLASSTSSRQTGIQVVAPPASLVAAKESTFVIPANKSGEDSAAPSDKSPAIVTSPTPAVGSVDKTNGVKVSKCSPSPEGLEYFTKFESLVSSLQLATPLPADQGTFNEDGSIGLDDTVGQKRMAIKDFQEQNSAPELKTPLSIPAVILPVISEANVDSNPEISDANEDGLTEGRLQDSFPRLNTPINASHSTATCGSYVPTICPSTPQKTQSTSLVTPVAKRLPKTAPSTPCSSPGSGFSFYHHLLSVNAQIGKTLNPQQERTQLELRRLRACGAGMTTTGRPVGLLSLDGTCANGKGWSVLERARTFGQTLWSNQQVKERTERAKQKEQEEAKAKELECVSEKLQISQQIEEQGLTGGPMRRMAMAQRFWSAKMMDTE